MFLSAASNIILRNLREIPHDWLTIGLFASAFVGSAAIAVAAVVVAGEGRASRVVIRGLGILGVCILLFDASAAHARGIVDEFFAVAGLDAAVALGVVFGLLRIPFRVLVQILAVSTVLLFGQTVANHAYQILQFGRPGGRAEQPQATKRAAGAWRAALPTQGNVYHIVLDAFQQEAFDIVQSADSARDLAGFTYYPRFCSNYGWTWFSIATALHGRWYREGESISDWRDVRYSRSLFWGRLKDAGWSVALYPHEYFHCSSISHQCVTADDAVAARERRDSTTLRSASPLRLTVDLWFLSLLPRSVRLGLEQALDSRTHAVGLVDQRAARIFSVTDFLSPRSKSATDAGGLPPPGRLDYAARGTVLFERFLEDEGDRPGHGQYVYVHILLPHGPMVVDASCTYVGHPQQTRVEDYTDAYLRQVQCSLHLIRRLISRLKELERFDDALIIVHGDHGITPTLAQDLVTRYADRLPSAPVLSDAAAGPAPWQERTGMEWIPFGVDTGFPWWSPQEAALRSSALLLVKMPQAAESATSSLPVQMVDIAPTILTHAGLSSEQYAGIPLQTMPERLDRDIVYFSGHHLVGSSVPIVGDAFWKYVLTDGQWRLQGEVAVTK